MSDILDNIATLSEQCEQAGEIEAAAFLDQALALLDQESLVRGMPLASLSDDLRDSYMERVSSLHSIGDAQLEVACIIQEASRSVGSAIETLKDLKHQISESDDNALQKAATLKALVILIESCNLE